MSSGVASPSSMTITSTPPAWFRRSATTSGPGVVSGFFFASLRACSSSDAQLVGLVRLRAEVARRPRRT